MLTAAVSAAALLACGGEETAAPVPQPQQESAPQAKAAPAKPQPTKPRTKNKVEIHETDAEGNPLRISGTDARGGAFQASIGDDVQVPDSFPSDVLMFPNASPMAAMTAESEGTIVTFRSEAPQPEIYEFYKKQLSDDGWAIESEKSLGGQLSIQAVKAGRKASVTIAGTRGDSRISVIVTD
jgi:hypothetical protein